MFGAASDNLKKMFLEAKAKVDVHKGRTQRALGESMCDEGINKWNNFSKCEKSDMSEKYRCRIE